MQHPTILEVRQAIRELNYLVSIHAAEELDDDNLTIFDLERIILAGRIRERQRDCQTREIKCVISGPAIDGSAAETVVKFGPTGRLIVITVYRAR